MTPIFEQARLAGSGRSFLASGAAALWIFATLALGGCAPAGPGPGGAEVSGSGDESKILTVYSGRNEKLIGPLLARFGESRGVEIKVRYGGTAEIAATLLEEGENSPADVFISQDAAALGAVAAARLTQTLPYSVVDRVPARLRSVDGSWVGLSGRARTVVYNTDRLSPDDLPQSLDEVTDRRFRGRFGVAPFNASFQAHMAVYGTVHGDEALARLLAGIKANEARTYPKNSAIVEAVIAGEIEWGLVNHYYLWRALKEQPEAPASNFVLPEGEASSFVNVAGAAVISDRPLAVELIEFLLTDEAQSYFATETYEYPVVPGVPAAADLEPLESLRTPAVDFAEVGARMEAAALQIRRSGLS